MKPGYTDAFWASILLMVYMILIKNKNKNKNNNNNNKRADPSGLVRPLPPSSKRLRLVLIPLGSLEARVSDHLLTTRYLETLEYRH